MPTIVYKYYGPERADVLKSFRVRFSQLAALNDPFEFLVQAKPGELQRGARRMAGRMSNLFGLLELAIGGAAKSIRDNEQLKPLPAWTRGLVVAIVVPIAIVLTLLLGPFISKTFREVMQAAADDFEVVLFEEVRKGLVLIFSCSQTWASVPMWAHYAANHTGFAIGLDPAAAFPNDNPRSDKRFITPVKVEYVQRTPAIGLFGRKEVNFLAAKMDQWAYEQEWRFMNMADGAAQRGMVVNGHELLLFAFEPQSIREIILGANCPTETVVAILDAIAAADLKLDLYQVKPSSGYGFERARIETIEDLRMETAPGGIVQDLRDMKFDRLQAAFANLHTSAKDDRMARWLANISEQFGK